MEEGIKLDRTGETGDGIRVKREESELRPPLEAETGGEEKVEEVIARKVTGKIPIRPAVIKSLFRFKGMLLAELTGYKGWIYPEEELDAIATLIAKCGWQLSLAAQVAIAVLTMHGVKFGGYLAWKRKRKGEATGEVEREKREGKKSNYKHKSLERLEELFWEHKDKLGSGSSFMSMLWKSVAPSIPDLLKIIDENDEVFEQIRSFVKTMAEAIEEDA